MSEKERKFSAIIFHIKSKVAEFTSNIINSRIDVGLKIFNSLSAKKNISFEKFFFMQTLIFDMRFFLH